MQKNCKGSALITVLFITSLIIIILSIIQINFNHAIYRTNLINESSQNHLIQQNAITQAKFEIENNENIDIPTKIEPIFDSANLFIQILDAQDRININECFIAECTKFENLLANFTNLTDKKIKELSTELKNWFKDRENIIYNTTSLYEIIPWNILVNIESYLIALPEQAKININTISEELLPVLDENLTLQDINLILQTRQLYEIDEIKFNELISKLSTKIEDLGFSTEFIEIKIEEKK